MKLKLDPKILNMPLEEQLRSHLKDAKDPKSKIYFAIAYFQYLNRLSANKAIILFKRYILEGQQQLTYPFSIYLSKNRSIVTKYIDIPLKIDNFLAQFIPEIMNYKDLVAKVAKNKYIRFLKKHLKINASDILTYAIYKIIYDIGIYNLIALNKHWALFSRKLIPHLLKNKAQL